MTFDQARALFSNQTLVTSCYFILGGTSAGQGVVIEREQKKPHAERVLSAKNWYLLQTNYDADQDVPFCKWKKTKRKKHEKNDF